MAFGGILGDGYAALVGLSKTKVFDINNPDDSAVWPVGGLRSTWIKNHRLLLGGDILMCLDSRSGETSEFFSSSPTELLATHPINPYFYTYTIDKIRFYDSSRRWPTHTIPLPLTFPLLTSLEVCGDTETLLGTTMDGRILGWSLLSGSLENELTVQGAILSKVVAVGHGFMVVLDVEGHLYWANLPRQWLQVFDQPELPRTNVVYNHERRALFSGFGDQVEVLTATEREIINLPQYANIVDLGVSRDGNGLLACHPRHLISWSLVTRGVCWDHSLDPAFMGQKQLAVIPFCS